jgi:hypothetical protein
MAEEKAASRRDFLKLAATGVPAAAAVAVTGGRADAAALGERSGEGLARTEHVEKYLESARF